MQVSHGETEHTLRDLGTKDDKGSSRALEATGNWNIPAGNHVDRQSGDVVLRARVAADDGATVPLTAQRRK